MCNVFQGFRTKLHSAEHSPMENYCTFLGVTFEGLIFELHLHGKVRQHACASHWAGSFFLILSF